MGLDIRYREVASPQSMPRRRAAEYRSLLGFGQGHWHLARDRLRPRYRLSYRYQAGHVAAPCVRGLLGLARVHHLVAIALRFVNRPAWVQPVVPQSRSHLSAK